ncbi:hypothetical protein TNCV_668331 [Trichonephila clavipes]|nr:hypothetical protein TNCV_668331 [Trichonephila clavipes]
MPPLIIISGAGPCWRCKTQLFSILSPRCIHTRIRPLWCYRQMRDSSVKATSVPYAAHILLSSLHCWRRHLWFCCKGRPSNERLAVRPRCSKCRRILREDTERCITDSMCCSTIRDVTERSVTVMRTIHLSSREVVH